MEILKQQIFHPHCQMHCPDLATSSTTSGDWLLDSAARPEDVTLIGYPIQGRQGELQKNSIGTSVLAQEVDLREM